MQIEDPGWGCCMLPPVLVSASSAPVPLIPSEAVSRWRRLLVALGSAGLLLLACGRQPTSPSVLQPNIFVILIDCLRADHVGVYGYSRDTTPHLDAFASEAVIFSEAITQSTFTKTSIASLFTSLYPHTHGVFSGSREDAEGTIISDVLSHDELTIAEALSDAGYVTGAFLQQAHLRTYMGFSQGFSEYDADAGGIKNIHSKTLKWLPSAARRGKLFAYLHYIDLHDPYKPKPPYDSLYGDGSNPYSDLDLESWGEELTRIRKGERTLDQRELDQMVAYYDGLITFMDKQIGEFFEQLKHRGLYDDSLIIVTSDHGDGFMEHGFVSHSTVPYDELLRVPLLIRFPTGSFGGTVVDEQVQLIDLMPTILDVAGIATHGAERMEGVSLLDYVDKGRRKELENDHPPYTFSEVAYGVDQTFPWISIRTKDLKYLFHPDITRDMIFDLQSDPGETTNIIESMPAKAKEYRRLALAAAQGWEQRNEGEAVAVDEETVKQLEALGYIN